MLFLISLLFLVFVSAQATAPVVDLGYVKYAGGHNATTGINYYRGIRFAESPTGQLRWREPVPIEQNTSYVDQTIDATQEGPGCYQGVPFWSYPVSPAPLGVSVQSEDCLLLDVLVPANPISQHLPVMVQIHGGGYTEGSASTVAPGDALVNASNGALIYVQIQYRLGMWGFLGGHEVAQNGVRNAGLYDQRAALNWVQRHISAFGGDPAKVTIIGGSAGGGSVTYQLMAGGGYDQPPFRAAIAEYPWWQPYMNESSQEVQLFNVLNLANCTNLNCLRSLPAEQLQAIHQQSYATGYGQAGAAYGVFYYGPVVDGSFIIELPHDAFKAGRFYDVPLIVDRDGYEGVAFSNMSVTTQAEETADAQILFPGAGPSFFSRLYQLYPAANYNSTFFQRQSWFGDMIIDCPTYFMASGAVDHNSNSSAVFKMLFYAGSELHGASSPFLFGPTPDFEVALFGLPNNLTIAEILQSYYISFAITLDPNPLRLPDAVFWPSYEAGGGTAPGEDIGFTVLDITYTTIGPLAPDPDAAPQCDFFSSYGLVVGN